MKFLFPSYSQAVTSLTPDRKLEDGFLRNSLNSKQKIYQLLEDVPTKRLAHYSVILERS